MHAKSTFFKSFTYAFEGIDAALKGRNFKIIVICGFLISIAGFVFQISAPEWILLVLTINVVVVAELVNTAIEAVVDLVSPEIHSMAKIAKDVAVAGVLVSSMFSIIIAAIIFLPKILPLL